MHMLTRMRLSDYSIRYPDVRILWAHAGFEYSLQVEALMDNYPNLWADLSFRWEDLLIKHADRFMLGVDTYTPERWDKIQDTLDWYERMFSALPDATAADKIRYKEIRSG
ncbi:hypothetical protein [Thiohalophilus sp.]|uniref:hypothetical protein n=1 Tax=Thiohalophilus sp. TaxID=3028392 RepID=UPI002ACD2530|nr:hypothetical protein [Thiohalophilus sp.]MDZ7803256.1 hypothetical protein [Thiohalophilus sp.]